MIKPLRIHAGKYKGKTIQVANNDPQETNFTPGIIKKSVFSILSSMELKGILNLEKSVFIDLYSGSGQMGLEALSHGFGRIIFNEINTERFENLQSIVSKYQENLEVYNRDAFRIKINLDGPIDHIVYYIDPPYSLWKSKKKKLNALLLELIESPEKNLVVFVQSNQDLKIEGFETRRYGRNYLGIFKKLFS